ncbi:hypothetical protein ES708_32668 [subsurface metagenome]
MTSEDLDSDLESYSDYFNSLGYKYISRYHKIIVQDFQRHVFPNEKKEWDGIIGPITKGRMEIFDKDNFCPEVFEPILGNIEDIDCYELEKYCLTLKLSGLSWAFIDTQDLYKVNVLHNIAHAVLESASGTSFIARMKNNLYGFRAYDSSPYASAGKFKDFPDCIDTWTKWWVDKYLIEEGKYYNGNNEKGVNVRYATSPIAGINKAFIVQNLRERVRG